MDASRWGPFTRFVHAGRPDRSGTFQIGEILPGEYFIVAVDYLESGEELDPVLLERLKPLATRVTLEAGRATALTLTLLAR